MPPYPTITTVYAPEAGATVNPSVTTVVDVLTTSHSTVSYVAES